VPPQERFEDPGVPLGEEPLEELRVGGPRDHPVGE
jgi:hypothetical protein